jgi:hypothetical protein
VDWGRVVKSQGRLGDGFEFVNCVTPETEVVCDNDTTMTRVNVNPSPLGLAGSRRQVYRMISSKMRAVERGDG